MGAIITINGDFTMSDFTNFGGVVKNNRKSGGGSAYRVGVWRDKTGGQHHIKTAVLGVDNGQGFVWKVEGGKIIIRTLTEAQEELARKAGLGVFKSSTDGGKKWHNYAVVGDSAEFGQACDIIKGITGGDLAVNINSDKGAEVLAVFDVAEWGEEGGK